ncbi:hypothetical protein BJY00DRAFT_286196 [Aspergillus carlsbadensis]|nr:hypothetical protein BJY00DRAFT_286196 [Aspergillus carlsbadensis]
MAFIIQVFSMSASAVYAALSVDQITKQSTSACTNTLLGLTIPYDYCFFSSDGVYGARRSVRAPGMMDCFPDVVSC